MLSEETRDTYYSMIREVLDPRLRFVHGLLKELQQDHDEARKKEEMVDAIFAVEKRRI